MIISIIPHYRRRQTLLISPFFEAFVRSALPSIPRSLSTESLLENCPITLISNLIIIGINIITLIINLIIITLIIIISIAFLVNYICIGMLTDH